MHSAMATIESGTSLESTTPLDASTPIITEGCYAVVRKVGGEHQRVVRLTANSNVLVEKLRFEAESAIGHPFGLFEVIGKRLVPATVEDLRKRDGGDIEMAAVDADNVGLNGNEQGEVIAPSAIDAETRQQLTEEQISEMKKGGAQANTLVSKLVSGSASFASRTTHAKSKYIRRKTKKHSDRVFILKPTIRLLCEAYLRKDYDRAGCLRLDQLSLIIHQGAVHTGRKVLVFDQVLGLITAAVTERLAGAGACIHLHRGTVPQSIPCFNSMEFGPEILSAFYPVRIDCLLNGFAQPSEEGEQRMEVEEASAEEADDNSPQPAEKEKQQVQQQQSKDKEGWGPRKHDEAWQAAQNQKKADRLQREADGLAAIEQGLDTILIGSRSVDPCSLLELLYDKLRGSGNVVVYSPTIQHVTRAQQWLRERGAIHIVLTDQMYRVQQVRVQQVLPDRTHPLMSQMVVGGYVLAAIKVLPAGPAEKKE
ncbi:hypothetical protein PRIPAC_86629 [Pristionchus pacificus]|uniref:tRNA (adenine(58)-N(1))-methyltransferase non-catalytic subunit TRM6 n=1 Tax=Pristionchus pacificus TaxID=54126 RepID=A0A2A6BNX0_PRIPA|nr:hypothetical protein PRIPAC_86629 [Pristionchus pacificus]|eukprot:PDM67599.1 hypothetical protein PRIPAC_49016 [Pristionchus pacificus]